MVRTYTCSWVNDQIDVEFTVEEEFSGSIGDGLGYGAYGLVLGLNYNENNAFGTGRAIGMGIDEVAPGNVAILSAWKPPLI